MDVSTKAIVDTLAAQRNQALDVIAQQNGHIAELNARIEELTKPSQPDTPSLRIAGTESA
jgi:hypothetical protein